VESGVIVVVCISAVVVEDMVDVDVDVDEPFNPKFVVLLALKSGRSIDKSKP
jgi:hypothetical protein